jgi:glutaredoxin
VSTDPAAVRDLVHKYRSRSTPTIIIDEQVIVGFDPQQLDQLLAQ